MLQVIVIRHVATMVPYHETFTFAENLPSSVIISVAVAVSITIIGIAVLLSTCWIFTMILKRRLFVAYTIAFVVLACT